MGNCKMSAFPQTRDQDANLYFLACLVVVSLGFHFVYQSVFFTFERRPDEVKAVSYFIGLVSGSTQESFNGDWVEETWTRLVLFIINGAIAGGLVASGLAQKRTAVLVAIWPLSTFLFSKIYWEFFYFPLCLIRPDLSIRKESYVIVLLSVSLLLTGEANLGVVLTFRAALLCQKYGFKRLTPAGIVGLGLVLDWAMRTGMAFSLPWIGGLLRRFDWTRNFANPDYTPIESLAVFVTSFHFFSLHTGAIWIDAVFSLIILAILFQSAEFRQNLRDNIWIVMCFFSIFFFYTHVTYAFQNARYYFFFLPILAQLTPFRVYPVLAAVGFLHVIIRSFEFL